MATTTTKKGRTTARAKGEAAVAALIDGMPEPDKALSQRVHDLVVAAAPELEPRTWYGMPAYAKDGKVVCFFRSATKFDERYATLGFNEAAQLDDGNLWPTSYALVELTDAEATQISRLVQQAVGR